jgi:hypothetical protein
VQAHWLSNSASGYKRTPFSVIPFLIFGFFLTFFFPSIMAPHQQQLALYTTAPNDKRGVTLSFSPS